ncbi:hypothetical protein BGW80DRAFT_582356 [Lactifluus volemus]|nr:hypothetical protein BGW80DRAFT_582356 [Lactifluus volemus]
MSLGIPFRGQWLVVVLLAFVNTATFELQEKRARASHTQPYTHDLKAVHFLTETVAPAKGDHDYARWGITSSNVRGLFRFSRPRGRDGQRRPHNCLRPPPPFIPITASVRPTRPDNLTGNLAPHPPLSRTYTLGLRVETTPLPLAFVLLVEKWNPLCLSFSAVVPST